MALIIVILGVAYYLESTAVRRERETYRAETFVSNGDAEVAYVGNLSVDAYAADSAVGRWLAGCDGEDRNEQFDAYVLRHEAQNGDVTTYTYLVYYRHGTDGLAATPALLTGGNGHYRIELTYTDAAGTNGYALSRFSVTLPTEDAPFLSLIYGEDTVGSILTKTEEPIPEA